MVGIKESHGPLTLISYWDLFANTPATGDLKGNQKAGDLSQNLGDISGIKKGLL